MYIEGAGTKGKGALFHASLGGFKDMKRVAFLAAGIGYKLYCRDYIKRHQAMCSSPPATPATSPVDPTFRQRIGICSITGTVITLNELMQTSQSVMGPGGQKYEKYKRRPKILIIILFGLLNIVAENYQRSFMSTTILQLDKTERLLCWGFGLAIIL